jgi:hypothetical protein
VVIFIILVVVIIGNVAALKHASHLRLEWMEKKQGQKSDLEKLTELDKKHHPEEHQ